MLKCVERINELGVYTDDDKKTEEYACAEAKVFGDYYDETSVLFDTFLKTVDGVIRSGDVNGFLAALSDNFEIIQFYNDYLELKAIGDICYNEIEAGEKVIFLNISDDRCELIRIFREIKYRFFRIQFYNYETGGVLQLGGMNSIGLEEDKKDICILIKENGISRSAIEYMTDNWSLDRFRTAKFLADAFLGCNMLSYALQMFRKCNSIDEGLEEVLVPMARIYHLCDRDAIATKCLDAIVNPSDAVEVLYREYGQEVNIRE